MIFEKWLKFTLLGVFIVFLFLLPFILPPFLLYLSNEILIYALFTYSFYLLFSHVGYLSFGHGAYFALGAYSVAIVYKNYSSAIWLPFLTAIIVVALVSVVLGFLCVRLGKIYFAFITLAFGQMVYTVLYHWRSVTGGDDGIPNVSRGVADFLFLSLDLNSPRSFFYFSLLIFLLLVFLLWKIVNSSFGLSLRSIRDNIERTKFVGIKPNYYVLMAFVISALYAGVAGGLHGSLTKMVSPEMSYWTSSTEPIIMGLMGGVSSFAGPLIGAIFFVLLKTYLMALIGNWMLFLGIILLLMVLFFKNGVAGFITEKMEKYEYSQD